MAGINPISGISSPVSMPSAASGVRGTPAAPAADFGQMFRAALDNVEGEQQASTAAVQDLLTGKTQDVLPVVSAVAKADMSFKLLLGVRNKVIEAYKQTMNMQI